MPVSSGHPKRGQEAGASEATSRKNGRPPGRQGRRAPLPTALLLAHLLSPRPGLSLPQKAAMPGHSSLMDWVTETLPASLRGFTHKLHLGSQSSPRQA